MNRLILVLVFVLLIATALFAVDFKATTDYVGLAARVPDTTKSAAYQTPDSVQVVVQFHGATNSGLCINAWYEASDAQADTGAGILTWWDQVADIDADSGAGLYTVTARFRYTTMLADVYRYYEFYLGTENVNVASVSNDALNLATDVTAQLLDSNVADIAVVPRDTTATGIALVTTAELYDQFAAVLSDSALSETDLDTKLGNIDVWDDGTRTLTSLSLDALAGTLDSLEIGPTLKALFGKAVWRTDTTGYDAIAGSFGKVNTSHSWGNLAFTQAWLSDTLPALLGTLRAAGLKTWSRQRKTVNVDTLFVGLCLTSDCGSKDTTAYNVFWHTGGSAGGSPDSTRWFSW